MGKSTKKVQVIVPPREGGFNGWHAAGRHWAPGQHEVELEDHEIANLARRPGVLVLMNGKTVKPDDSVQSRITTQLTADEMAAVERFRAEARREISNDSPGYTLEKEDREEAFLRTKSEVSSSISGTDTPLQNRDVLHGMPPPPGPGGSDMPAPKPVDEKGKPTRK